MLIPAGAKHGFRILEKAILHVRATLAAPIFEASYENVSKISRRWGPGWPPVTHRPSSDAAGSICFP